MTITTYSLSNDTLRNPVSVVISFDVTEGLHFKGSDGQ